MNLRDSVMEDPQRHWAYQEIRRRLEAFDRFRAAGAISKLLLGRTWKAQHGAELTNTQAKLIENWIRNEFDPTPEFTSPDDRNSNEV